MSLNNIPKIKVGNLEFYLMQGGMGVGVSQDELVSAVANEGGAGTIAAVELGTLKGASGNYMAANKEAFREVIRSARKKSNGVIGVNIMHALVDYAGLVEIAVEENVDYIASGAGIAKDLPKYLKGKDIKLFPIVRVVQYVHPELLGT